MKLTRFRIKNYKSIVDSGNCSFSDDGVTILAGKNEAGKTAILEALADFGKDEGIRDAAVPLAGDGVSEVSVSFILEEDEVREVQRGIEIEERVNGEIELCLIRRRGSEGYSCIFYGDSGERIGLDIVSDGDLDRVIQPALEEVRSLLKEKRDTDFDFSSGEGGFAGIRDTLAEVKLFLERDQSVESVSDILSKVDFIMGKLEERLSVEKKCDAFIARFEELYLPSFILYSSFEENFPDSIPISAIRNVGGSRWIEDLQRVSNFSMQRITDSDPQVVENHLNTVNVDLSEKFKRFWTQDSISLKVSKDGGTVFFWIHEGGKSYRPSQRSRGQQWYLSFYIKTVARIKDARPCVLLIDEPGLHLHAKAQKDLLNVLKEHSSEYPIVFGTHSPYLIEEGDLGRLRLVVKTDEEGTKIYNRVNAYRNGDQETLTPILTAIGLGVNDSITTIDRKNNVVVEGPSDVYYLQAFKKIIGNTDRLNFISGGGASTMYLVGTILRGWGANVFYLLDNDDGREQGEGVLKRSGVLSDEIKVVMDGAGGAIEDVLTKRDFKRFVLEDETVDYAASNSGYVKSKDKVLLARHFLQRSEGEVPRLEQESLDNIRSIFSQLDFFGDKGGH